MSENRPHAARFRKSRARAFSIDSLNSGLSQVRSSSLKLELALTLDSDSTDIPLECPCARRGEIVTGEEPAPGRSNRLVFGDADGDRCEAYDGGETARLRGFFVRLTELDRGIDEGPPAV